MERPASSTDETVMANAMAPCCQSKNSPAPGVKEQSEGDDPGQTKHIRRSWQDNVPHCQGKRSPASKAGVRKGDDPGQIQRFRNACFKERADLTIRLLRCVSATDINNADGNSNPSSIDKSGKPLSIGKTTSSGKQERNYLP